MMESARLKTDLVVFLVRVIFAVVYVRVSVMRFFAAAMVVAFVSTTAAAQDDIDTSKLEQQISEYGSCQSDCAISLAADLAKGAPKTALEIVGAFKSAPKAPKPLQLLSFVVVAQNIYETGRKIIGDDAACYQSCDKLNSAVVKLGQSGALGPMKRGERVDPAILSDPAVLDAYTKFVKPIPLPAEERSKAWGDFISSLS